MASSAFLEKIERLDRIEKAVSRQNVSPITPTAGVEHIAVSMPEPLARMLYEQLARHFGESGGAVPVAEGHRQVAKPPPIEQTCQDDAPVSKPPTDPVDKAAKRADATFEIKGVLAECGFRHTEQYGPRYHVTVKKFRSHMPHDEVGADLERAVADAGVRPGDWISLQYLGKTEHPSRSGGTYSKKNYRIERIEKKRSSR